MGYIIVFIIGLLFGWLANSINTAINNYSKPNAVLPTNQHKATKPLININKHKVINQQKTKQPPINLIKQLQVAWSQNDYRLVTNLIKKIDNNHNYDPIYLWASAYIFAMDGQIIKAINNLADLFLQPDSGYSQQTIIDEILSLKNKYLKQNQVSNKIDKRIELLQKINTLLPEETETHYQLAIEMITKTDFYQANIHLNYLKTNPDWDAQAKILSNKIQKAQRFINSEIKIPLIYENNSWMIMAQINNEPAIKLLLDTGANLTLIKQSFVTTDDIFPNQQQTITIHTAAGKSNAYKMQIKSLKIGKIIDKDFTIATTKNVQLPTHIDGLLGTDWLNRFEFIIDKERKLLLLKETSE